MFCCPLRSSSARSWASASATRSPHRKKKGMCMGGVPPLGYRAQDRKLVIIGSTADRVDERFGSPRRRHSVLTRRALPDFAEPYLSRIRIAGNKAASSRSLTSADCGYACQKPEASSARRETTLQREIAVKNVCLGIFDPAKCRRNPDFLGGFPPKPRSVLRNRQGIPRLSGVSSRAHEGESHSPSVPRRHHGTFDHVWSYAVTMNIGDK